MPEQQVRMRIGRCLPRLHDRHGREEPADAGEEDAAEEERRATPLASSDELDETFKQLEAALEAIDFFKAHNPPAIMRTLRAILRRADLDQREARLWKAIAFEIRKRIEPR